MAYSKAEKREYDRLYKQRPHVKEKVLAYEAERRKLPEVQAYRRLHTHRHKLKRYGLTEAQYETMLAEQGGLCAICHQSEYVVDNGSVMRLSVDHCHDPHGKVRGLLCGDCNRGIGLLGDDPELLRAAANYIEAARIKS